MSENKILIVDDDDDIRHLLKYNLEKSGFITNIAANGLECLEMVKSYNPDLILLDVMMPGMDGIEVCERIKSDPQNKNIFICFLTARSEDYSQIAGLEAGGDDYVSKPIKPKVLVSRINAILRRTSTEEPKEIKNGIQINYEKYVVLKNGEEVQLPKKEFELLSLLHSKPNFVFRREQILNHVWGTDIVVGDRTIDVHIRKLRQKFGNNLINTIKGIGYQLKEQ